MSHIKELFDLAKQFVEGRRPLYLKTIIYGDSPPVFVLRITNTTKDMPVYIHCVRIHYGHKDYNHSFLLSPNEKAEIIPKDTKEYQLGYGDCRIQRHSNSINDDNIPLSFSNPGDLFRAIANGRKEDSWAEIDFNEYRYKKYLRGKIKSVFHSIMEIEKKRMGQQSACG